MSATIRAVRACASTLLFHSLRLQAFRGAVPHVLIVVDRVPCAQQKALVEGYLQVLRVYQQEGHAYLDRNTDDVMQLREAHTADSAQPEQSHKGELFIPLMPDAVTPCGSAGLASKLPSLSDDAVTPISYSLLPFQSTDFLDVVKRLQRFFRHCGDGQRHQDQKAAQPPAASTVEREACRLPVWSAERFAEEYRTLCPLLEPLLSSSSSSSDASVGSSEYSTDVPSTQQGSGRCEALYYGPTRELLGCILIQQNAFQNEMKRYRLRLSLFDLGIRVVEHCHLLIMSAEADRLAKEGQYCKALENDQVYSYARSCAFRPEQSQTLARAIADAIDLHSWQRGARTRQGDVAVGAAASAQTPPPASFAEALNSAELQAIFNPGALHWGAFVSLGNASTDMEAALRQPIDGPGVPLSIVSRDSSKVLTFVGGMEDCLTNTGFYAAAYSTERNDVERHRERFPIAIAETAATGEATAPDALAATEDNVSETGSTATATITGSTAAPAARGRMKKKNYLAMLKAKGHKPNKRPPPESDEDEDGALGRGGASAAGSCISNSIGGTFPIGEVISESFDLSQLHGTCDVFAYPDVFKQVTMSKPAPFTMTVEKGIVTHISEDAPTEFLDLLSLVRQVEGDCYVRELGIGLNPYVGLSHVVSDVTTFERQWGIHVSLGQRHPLFVKQRARCNADGSVAANVRVEGPVLKRKAGKYHIDVFLDAAQLRMGDVFSIDFTRGIAIP